MGFQSREIFIADAPGMRLDQFLAQRLARYSRSHLKDLIAKGCVKVGGALGRADFRLKGEERIEVAFPENEWRSFGDFETWIVHEDKHLLVLDKPAGLLMHPLGTSWLKAPEAALAEEDPNLAGILQRLRPELLKSGVSRCGIVHRLDRQTSGVLLVAKTLESQEGLIEQFQERKIQKFYRAIVRGRLEGKNTSVSAPVGRRPGHRRILVTPFGKSAETAFQVLDSCSSATTVEAKPLTGRTHQIRAHLALLGHPVMGDPEFDLKGNKPDSSTVVPPRLMLHAYEISFTHPGSGKKATFKAQLPADFKNFWKQCQAAAQRPGNA